MQGILRKTLPQEVRVWVFGSRAKGTTERAADLDLAIDVGRPLTHNEQSELSDEFEESDLPYTVDVVDWQSVSPQFKQLIDSDRVLFPFTDESCKQVE